MKQLFLNLLLLIMGLLVVSTARATDMTVVDFAQNEQKSLASDSVKIDFIRWQPTFSSSYGFLRMPEGVKGSAYRLSFFIGANYYLSKMFYVGTKIGYNLAQCHYYDFNIKERYHFISLPIEVGLNFGSKKVAIVPYAGIGFNMCVDGTLANEAETEVRKQDLDAGGMMGVESRFGLRLKLWGINISGAAVFPLNEIQIRFLGEKVYPELTIAWGF